MHTYSPIIFKAFTTTHQSGGGLLLLREIDNGKFNRPKGDKMKIFARKFGYHEVGRWYGEKELRS